MNHITVGFVILKSQLQSHEVVSSTSIVSCTNQVHVVSSCKWTMRDNTHCTWYYKRKTSLNHTNLMNDNNRYMYISAKSVLRWKNKYIGLQRLKSTTIWELESKHSYMNLQEPVEKFIHSVPWNRAALWVSSVKLQVTKLFTSFWSRNIVRILSYFLSAQCIGLRRVFLCFI